jgi:hypothetical protein
MTLLNEVDDPRRPSNGTLHDFQEILVIALYAVLSDADNVDDFAEWARQPSTTCRESSLGTSRLGAPQNSEKIVR